MRNLGIIPARAGSKRVPRKNVRLLGGKPLVAWTIEAALKAASLDRLVVSSDDPHVLRIAATYDGQLILRRPRSLASDRSLAIDYVHHALKACETTNAAGFDTVTIIQPTSPFTLPEDIDATVDLLAKSHADTAVSVMKLDQVIHPFKLKVFEDDRLRPYLEEEQGRMADHQLPQLYSRNGAVYATRRAVVNAGQIIGEDCRGYVMPPERSVDINEEIDMAFAEFLLARRQARLAA